MRYWKAAICFFLVFLIQTTALGDLFRAGAAPNLLLVFVVVYTWMYEESYGLVFGIVFGVMLDLSTQTIFGAQTLTFVLAAIPPMLLRNVFNPERLFADVLMVALATPINTIPVWCLYHLAGSTTHFLHTLENLPMLVILHVGIAAVLHLCLVRSIIKNRRDRRFVGGVR